LLALVSYALLPLLWSGLLFSHYGSTKESPKALVRAETHNDNRRAGLSGRWVHEKGGRGR